MKARKRQDLVFEGYGGGRAGRTFRRAWVSIAVLAIGVGCLTIVVASPLLLQRAYGLNRGEWSRLSEIGQTYGAASAILAMLALAGVTGSLLFQSLQAKAQQLQSVRQFHLELMRIALADPELFLPCWDPAEPPELSRTKRQLAIQDDQRHTYMNLIVNYQYMAYEIKAVYEPEVRRMFAGMFQGDLGRQFWSISRHVWVLTSAGSRRGRRFFRIVDEEYRKAVASGPPQFLTAASPVLSQGMGSMSTGNQRSGWVNATTLGFIGGFAMSNWISRRHR